MQLVLCNSPGFIQIFFKSKFSVDDFKRNIIYFKKITPFPWSIFKYRKGDLDPPFENPCFIFLKILVGVSYFNWNRIFFFTLMFFSQVVNNKSSDNLRRICFSLLIISYLRVFLCFFSNFLIWGGECASSSPPSSLTSSSPGTLKTSVMFCLSSRNICVSAQWPITDGYSHYLKIPLD